MSRHARTVRWSVLLFGVMSAPGALAASIDDAKIVADLDTEYQAAVERDDWQTMDRILHPEFVLVVGRGTAFSREQLLDSTRKREIRYEKQVEVPGTQKVRLYGDHTAIVTALLWLKGTRDDGKSAFDRKLWFSDTYVRTKDGWKYAFGQASIALPSDGN